MISRPWVDKQSQPILPSVDAVPFVFRRQCSRRQHAWYITEGQGPYSPRGCPARLVLTATCDLCSPRPGGKAGA